MRPPSSGRPPLPREPLVTARRMGRSGWGLAFGLVLLMAGLALWMHRLQQSRPRPEPADGGPGASRLVPDGPDSPGPAVWLPFGEERCTPWHVSAVEPPPAASRALVLTSRVADPFAYVAAGFGDECGSPLGVLVLEALAPGELAAAVAQSRPELLVAVGRSAVELARREAPELPVLHALVQAPRAAGLEQPGLLGVSPWVPLGPVVRHLLRVLPAGHRRLAVLHPPGRFAALAAEARAAIEAGGRTAETIELDGQDDRARLERAARDAQAWLVLPDRKVIDHRRFNLIQIAAEQARIPLGVPDEEHVRAGAYAGVGPDSHRLGRQLCRLGGALERGRIEASGQVFCPEYSFAALHHALIAKLGYRLEPAQLEQCKLYKWH